AAADRDVLEALGEMAERQAVGGELGLERRTAGAGGDPDEQGLAIDVEQAAEVTQVERDHGRMTAAEWGHSADDAGPATERDDGDPQAGTGGEQGGDLVVRFGKDDGVGGGLGGSGALADEVGIALAGGVDDPDLVVGVNPGGADGVGQAAERG